MHPHILTFAASLLQPLRLHVTVPPLVPRQFPPGGLHARGDKRRLPAGPPRAARVHLLARRRSLAGGRTRAAGSASRWTKIRPTRRTAC
eukprot:scaffold15986_cov142-Isochrysis_galbana.AAC.2